jgi:hypothetical protein
MRQSSGDFRYVMGLGVQCFTAVLLRDAGMRRFSGPFDWLFAGPSITSHCFKHGMNDLLDRSQYIPDSHPKGWRHAGFTKQFGAGPIFAHHDMSLDEEYARFERAARRFETIISGDQRTLFVLMAPIEITRSPSVDELIQSISDRMTQYRLVIIGYEEPTLTDPRSVELIKENECVDYYRVTPKSGMPTGLQFEDPSDNEMVQAVIRGYPVEHFPSEMIGPGANME